MLSLSVVMLGACRIEQTPNEYFDQAERVEAGRREAAAEVEDRLRAFVAALSRGDAAEAELALNPGDNVQVFGPGRDLETNGLGATRLLLQQMAATPVAVRVQEISVQTAAVPAVAWYSLLMEAPGTEPEPALYRVTGVYRRDAGLWLMEQAHISGPLTQPAPPASNPSDSVADPAEGE